MPEVKEPAFFCTDLFWGGETEDRSRFFPDLASYLALYRDAAAERRVGEACVFNLYSAVAAAGIKAFDPGARIIIQLREPVEQMYSWHGVLTAGGYENLTFEAALDAEADRAYGRRLPRHPLFFKAYQYRSMASFSSQVERYLEVFGRDQVQVLMYEDLRRDPASTYRAVLRFLGIDESFSPDLAVVNPNQGFRSRRLYELLHASSTIDTAKRFVPRPLHRVARSAALAIFGWNLPSRPRPGLDPALQEALRQQLGPDVARLSGLLGRDLHAFWYGGGREAGGDQAATRS